MQASAFDEEAFFRAISESGVRALLIGRRALIALGLPVTTRDYDYWIPADDAAAFNEALRPLELYPTQSPEDARRNGRYVVEGDEHVDVLVARSVSTVDGKFGARPRDADDILVEDETSMSVASDDLAKLQADEERRLSPEEFATRVEAPWSAHEAATFAELVSWFNRRYPTVRARLASTRHLMAQWDRVRAPR